MASKISGLTGTLERRTGHAIHYTISYMVQGAEFGTDGAIVLLHDLLAGAFSWQSVMSQLAGCQRAIYAIDMLGYGESDHPWPGDTSIWGHADVLSYLFRDLKLTNIILVGHGLGGGIAQILATRLSREQVAALVLIDTLCYQHTFAENWPLPEMEKRRDFDAPKQTEVEDLIRDLRATLPQAVVNTKDFSRVIDDYIEPWDSELGKEVLFQHIRLLIPYYLNAVSTDLQVSGKPTLIIWADQDEQVPLKYGQRLHRDIPGSQLVVVANAGHLILFDAPEAVTKALTDFMYNL